MSVLTFKYSKDSIIILIYLVNFLINEKVENKDKNLISLICTFFHNMKV